MVKKLKNVTPKKFVVFLPLFLLGVIFVMDLFVGISNVIIRELMVLREIMLVIAIFLLLPVIKRLKWVQSKNVLEKTRVILLSVLGIYFLFFIFPDAGKNKEDFFTVFGSFQSYAFAFIFSVAYVLLGIIILFMLRDIIYVRRKKSTHRNFSLVILGILIFSGYILVEYLRSDEDFTSIKEFSGGGIGSIFLAVLISFMVVNSFRNSWINYLNKGQKVRYLFFSLIFVIGWPAFILKIFPYDVIAFSLLFEFFSLLIGLFLVIYWAMAFVAILFHLPTAGIVDRRMKEIQSLHSLGRTMSSEFNLDRLVVKINELSNEVTEAHASWLQIIDPKDGILKLVAYKNLNPKLITWIEQHPYEGIGFEVLQEKDAIWINDLKKDPRGKSLKKFSRSFDSLMAVPIIMYDKIIGVLCVLKVQEFGFIPDDLNMMRAFADQAAIAIENARLVQENIEKERFAQELKVAHEAQMKLLPKTMPVLKGLDIDAICVTANDVGGDYYDFFLFPDNRLGLVIGDVSGKGAEAAFYMAEVKGIMKSLAHTYISPREVLIRTNEILHESLEQQYFISLIYAVIDLNTWELAFSRAGHCPLIYRAKERTGVEFVEPRGIGIGLTRGPLFDENIEEMNLSLKDGDALLFFTDGVVEAMNKKKEEFEESRLASVFLNATHLKSRDIKKQIVHEVHTFVGGEKSHDDLTLIVVKVDHTAITHKLPEPGNDGIGLEASGE